MTGTVRRARIDDVDAIARVHYATHVEAYTGKLLEGVIESFTLEQRATMWSNIRSEGLGDVWVGCSPRTRARSRSTVAMASNLTERRRLTNSTETSAKSEWCANPTAPRDDQPTSCLACLTRAMTRDDPQDQFTITNVPASSRYELRDGDDVIGFAEYREHPDRMIFTHTVIDNAYEGRGLGSRLVRFVLEDAVARGKRIVPVCPFTAAYLRRHHDFDDHVDWPDAAADTVADSAL